MENIITTRFIDIRDLPTTQIEVLEASHEDADRIIVKVTYAIFDQVTGSPLSEEIIITKEQVTTYRQWLQGERSRLTTRFNNLNAFLDAAQPLVNQWLIDHPLPEPEPEPVP